MAHIPNILWICTDQQRWDTIGCYGNDFVTTPNLDRLAQQGLVFDHCYSQSPICTPSRAGFLTGRYPRTTRARQNGQCIPADEVLVTRLLSDAGYTCGLSGKLHLAGCEPPFCHSSERRIQDGYDAFFWSHHPWPTWPTNQYNLWLQEQGRQYETQAVDPNWHVEKGMPPELHQTRWCADRAISFIETSARYERPWLFSLNCFDPHFPFDPPESCLAPYLERLEEIPPPNYTEGELADKPLFQQPDQRDLCHFVGPHHFDQMTEYEHRLCRAAYWAMVDLIDQEVGRVLEALQRSGQADNTLVIFTSDHGELLGDHGLYYKGPYFYEPAVRVPLIVSWPGRIEPGRTGALVELIDLAPTLLDAADLDPWPGMQARSLWPLLRGEQSRDHHRPDVYSEYYHGMRTSAKDSHRETMQPFATMLRDERYKLVVAHGLEPGELYDLEADPAETHNLWNNDAAQSVKLRMLKRLTDRMAWMVDPLPARMSGY